MGSRRNTNTPRSNSNNNDTDTILPDWLAVSTEGFAGMNAGREPAHLVKELVQNALDAIDEERGGELRVRGLEVTPELDD